MVTDVLFLIDSTFLFKDSEAAFMGAPLLVDKDHRDHTRTFGVVRDLLRLRKRFGIRSAAVVIGEESLAATTDAVVDDLLPLLRQINASVLRIDGARVVDICAEVASSAQWIISTNPAMHQLVNDSLGVLIPRVGDGTEIITKKTLSDAGLRPEWIPAVLALSDGKDAPMKRRQAVRLLEIYGNLEAALADASSAPTADWKRKLAPRSESLIQIAAGLRIRTATLAPTAISLGNSFIDDSNASVEALKSNGLWSLIRMLPSRKLKFLGHNLKYDFAVLQRNGIDIRELYFDTMLAAHECFGDWEFWNLSALAKKLLGTSVKRYRDIVSDGETFLDRPFKELVEHACSDADIALRLHAVLTKELRKRGIEQHFFDGPMRVERLLVEYERDGVLIDIDRMKSVSKAAKASAEALRATAVAVAGCEFDVDSPKGTTEALRRLGIWEKTSRPLGESQMEQIAGEFPIVASIMMYRRERRRDRDIEAICAAAEKGRVYPSLSQCKSAHGSLSSVSPSLDEAMAAGAVLDRVLLGLFPDEVASIEILMEASGDTVLRKDLRTRKGKDGFIPGLSLSGEAEQRKALLLIAIGEPDPVVSRRFLIGRADTVKLRTTITSRYQALFAWLQDFRMAAMVNGFAEYRGCRKYLVGLRSSDIDKRNRAVRSAVRWLARY